MATNVTLAINDNTAVATWTDLTATGDAAKMGAYSDKTIGVSGTGTVTLEGSMDNIAWVALNDTAGVAISLAAATNDMAVILENPIYVRAINAGGTADVYINGVR